MANYNTAQTVTESKRVDGFSSIRTTSTYTISHRFTMSDDTHPTMFSSGLAHRSIARRDRRHVTSPIDAPGVTVSKTAVTVSEAAVGTTGLLYHQAEFRAHDQTSTIISVRSAELGNVRVNPTSLTFTPSGNWDQTQTVTVIAVNDDFDTMMTTTPPLPHRFTPGDSDYNNSLPIART